MVAINNLKGARGKASWANQAAKNDLIEKYPDEFEAFHAKRREQVGLTALAQGSAQIRLENLRMRDKLEQLEDELAILRRHLGSAGVEFTDSPS